MKSITSVKEAQKGAFDAMKAEFGYTNKLAAPRLVKVVVSSATGKAKDKNRNELVVDRLTKITGQKPSIRSAKQSIAAFKLREGDKIGVAVTLRGTRMIGFLDKFLNVATPRTRDFRGYNTGSIDSMGNLTIGVREQTIFPETADEDLRDVFSMAITIVTTAKSKAEAQKFFEVIGVPFKK